MKIVPLQDYVLVKTIDQSGGIKTGIDLENSETKGEVVRIGLGRATDSGAVLTIEEIIGMELKPGDIIYWHKFAEADTPQSIIDAGYHLVPASQIKAKETT